MTVEQLTEATRRSVTTDGSHCVTQDPEEPAGSAFLEVCDDNPVDVITSSFCAANAPECGGHPICAPCLTLARQTGLVT